MKAMLFNGSPRKNWNTAKMLEAAAEGARSAGGWSRRPQAGNGHFPRDKALG